MNGNCKECGKEVRIVEGRRKREFCGPSCRSKFYYKLSRIGVPQKKKGRPKKKSELDSKIDFTPPINSVYDGREFNHVIRDELALTETIKEENKPILKRIAEVEQELKSPPKNPLIGLKTWIRVRKDELESLRKQLK